ncbi:MAG: hypothetical protein COA47_14420 [Robiginitomaculum sp.]|nr:MAG: hypothetical protein COA47_14420 [Robiginitomaculum sp.]
MAGKGVEPLTSHVTVSAVNPSQGDFALPAPIDLRGVPAPKTLDNSIEANPARFGCRQLVKAEPDQRAAAPLETQFMRRASSKNAGKKYL